MDSKAVISWLGVVARPTTTVSVTGVSGSGAAGQVLAPVPITGVSAVGTAGMLISKARVAWVGITPRNVREVSINGVSSKLAQGPLTTPVPIHGVSTKGSAGHFVSRARISWLNISASPDKSVGITQVSAQGLAGDISDPAANLVPRMRVVYQNVADLAQVTANTAYAAYPAENLLNDTKSKPHRSTGPRAVYTLTWSSGQYVGCVALPATNLTSGATIRVKLFSDEEGTVLLGDSGVRQASPSQSSGVYGWGRPIDYTAFSQGGASKAAVWFRRQRSNVRSCVITVEDPFNPAGFIDCSRLVVGPFWEADKNPGYGAQAGTVDSCRTQRGMSGDLWAAMGAQTDEMSVSLTDIGEASRSSLGKALRSAARFRNVFVSLFPDFAETVAARALSSSWPTTPVVVGEYASDGYIAPGYFQAPSTAVGRYVSDGYVSSGYVEGTSPDEVPVLPPQALAAARSMEHDHMIYGRLGQSGFTLDSCASWGTKLEITGW